MIVRERRMGYAENREFRRSTPHDGRRRLLSRGSGVPRETFDLLRGAFHSKLDIPPFIRWKDAFKGAYEAPVFLDDV
jgi:hypothetical protein